jgi:polyisoprenoid-binding protein YceI
MNPRRIVAAAALASLILAAGPARAKPITWKIDPNHSRITFSIRHIFSKVPGNFDSFQGTIVFDPDHPAGSSVQVEIDPKSIDTKVERRDENLRGRDFFDVAHYPSITFVSAGVKDLGKGKLEVIGNLSMHGVTKQILLDTTILGSGPAMNGEVRAGFEAKAALDRKDFGITWNRQLDHGGMLLGDDVVIQLDIEAVAEPGPEQADPPRK